MSRAGDYETEQIGLRLYNHLAPLALNAIRDLRRDEALCDGYATRGDTAGRGTSDSSLTEAAIVKAEQIRETLQKLYTLRNAVERSVDAYAQFLKTRPEERIPAAADKPRCREGQAALGSARQWSDDLDCQELGEKSRLCPRHYMRWYRWKVDNEHDVTHLFEPSV